MPPPSSEERRDSMPQLNIRDFTRADAEGVRRICHSHFRSLSWSAVTFWVCGHIWDLCAILVIIKLFLTFVDLAICSALFLGYLLVRARWEMESYIRNDCCDLEDIYGTYMTDPMCHFWVADLIDNKDKLLLPQSPTQFSVSSCAASVPVILEETGITEDTEEDSEEDNSTGEPKDYSNSPVQSDASKSIDFGSYVYSRRSTAATVERQPSSLRQNGGAASTEFYDNKNDEVQPAHFSKKLLGFIGLAQHKDDRSVAQLVRLVVSHESRRMRIGSRLLTQLENYAREQGYREVRLYNNNLNTSPLNFVRQNGYELVQVLRRGLMRGDLLVWKKQLNVSESQLKNQGLMRRESKAAGILD